MRQDRDRLKTDDSATLGWSICVGVISGLPSTGILLT